MVRNPEKVTVAIILILIGDEDSHGCHPDPWVLSSDTARVGLFPSHCPFSSLPPSMITLYCLLSWSLAIFLSQTHGGLRLCPGPSLSSIFTHIHSRASFELIVWRHKCPSSGALLSPGLGS